MIWINYRQFDFVYASNMYICICQAVTDSTIRKAVSEGITNFYDLSYRTGCGTQCGSCINLACEVIDEALADSGPLGATTHLQVVASP